MSKISPYADRIVTPPKQDALTITEALDHLRLDEDDTDEPRNVAGYLKAAIGYVQEQTHRQLVQAVREIYLDAFPSGADPLLLPWAPLVSVDEVRHTDTAGDEQTEDDTDIASTYQVGLYDEPGWLAPVYGTTWSATRTQPRAVAVKFTCGYGTSPKDVDEAAREAVRLILGHLYENREETIESALRVIPIGAERLIEQLRYDDFVSYG